MPTCFIDPPSGWMYGFPKPIPSNELSRVREWLVENGYPQSEINSYRDNFYYRMWSVESDEEKSKAMSEQKLEHKQVIVVRRDLKMRTGKMVAQGAHASMKAILDLCKIEDGKLSLEMDERIEPWISGRFKKVCVYVKDESELLEVYQRAKDQGLICSLIKDAGLTEFNGVQTFTAVAVGPDIGEKVDLITGNLPLM